MSLCVKSLSLKGLGGAAILLVAGILITGCAAEKPLAHSNGVSNPTGSAPPSTEESASDVDGAKKTGFADSTECLVGTWDADNSRFAAIMAALMEEGGSVNGVTGKVVLTFTADGQTSTAYSDWTLSMSIEGMTSDVVRNGIDSGEFSVEPDEKLTMRETGSDSTVVVHVGGMTMGPQPATDTMPVTQAAFTCETSLLKIVTNEGELEFARRT